MFCNLVQYRPLPPSSLIETTQIWGKEFPGGVFYMKPGNSSFFPFVPIHTFARDLWFFPSPVPMRLFTFWVNRRGYFPYINIY